MVVEAQTGQGLSLEEADQQTGHEVDKGSWTFGAMLALANLGLLVTSIDALPPEQFVDDPATAIRRYYGDTPAALQFALAESPDLTNEVHRVRQCLGHPRIRFDVRPATLTDIEAGLDRGSVIVALNAHRLFGREDGYAGHFVVVTGIACGSVSLDNPLQFSCLQQEVPIDQFLHAWHSPGPAVANALVVSSPEDQLRP